jgi:hypothetical protein
MQTGFNISLSKSRLRIMISIIFFLNPDKNSSLIFFQGLRLSNNLPRLLNMCVKDHIAPSKDICEGDYDLYPRDDYIDLEFHQLEMREIIGNK